jgi:lipase chaperone LimK
LERNRMPRNRILIAALVLLVGAGSWYWRSASPEPPARTLAVDVPIAQPPVSRSADSSPTQATPRNADPSATDARQLRIAEVRRALLEGSLRGTEVDGAIQVVHADQLSLDMDLRRWFDYHLSVVGETSPQAIRDYLVELLQQTQSAAVMAQVLAAFDRYVAYLSAIDNAATRLQSANAIQRDALLRSLQQQVLGEAQTAGFFADEHAYADFRRARAEVVDDPSLNAEQRTERLQQLTADLPPAVRDALVTHQRSNADLDLAMQIQASSMDAQTRFESRENAFGAETAARLELADREQAQWQQQLDADTAIRRQLASELHLTDSQRAARLLSWRTQNLDAQHRQRIEALEHIKQLPELQVDGN